MALTFAPQGRPTVCSDSKLEAMSGHRPAVWMGPATLYVRCSTVVSQVLRAALIWVGSRTRCVPWNGCWQRQQLNPIYNKLGACIDPLGSDSVRVWPRIRHGWCTVPSWQACLQYATALCRTPVQLALLETAVSVSRGSGCISANARHHARLMLPL